MIKAVFKFVYYVLLNTVMTPYNIFYYAWNKSIKRELSRKHKEDNSHWMRLRQRKIDDGPQFLGPDGKRMSSSNKGHRRGHRGGRKHRHHNH